MVRPPRYQQLLNFPTWPRQRCSFTGWRALRFTLGATTLWQWKCLPWLLRQTRASAADKLTKLAHTSVAAVIALNILFSLTSAPFGTEPINEAAHGWMPGVANIPVFRRLKAMPSLE